MDNRLLWKDKVEYLEVEAQLNESEFEQLREIIGILERRVMFLETKQKHYEIEKQEII